MSTTPIIESEGDKQLARMLITVINFQAAFANAIGGGLTFQHQSQIDQFEKAASELDDAVVSATRHIYRAG